jgi:hypothetical protein
LSHTSPGPPPGAAVAVFEDDELDGGVAVLDGAGVAAGVAAGAGAAAVELVLAPVEGVIVVVFVEVVVEGLVVELDLEGLVVELEVDDLVAPHQVFTPLWPTQAPILVDALE